MSHVWSRIRPIFNERIVACSVRTSLADFSDVSGRVSVNSATTLRACYALPGTDMACRAIRPWAHVDPLNLTAHCQVSSYPHAQTSPVQTQHMVVRPYLVLTLRMAVPGSVGVQYDVRHLHVDPVTRFQYLSS